MTIHHSQTNNQAPINLSDLLEPEVYTKARNPLAAFHDDPRWLPRPDGKNFGRKTDGGTTYTKANATGDQVRFIAGDGISIITLHRCVVEGKLEAWAREIVERCGSYAEAHAGNVNIFTRQGATNFAAKGKKAEYTWSLGRVTIATANVDCPVSGVVVHESEIVKLEKDSVAKLQESAKKTHQTTKLDMDGSGNVKKTPDNASTILTEHRVMKGVFAFDEFRQRIIVMRRPDGRHFTGKHWEGGVLEDAHGDDVRAWLSASPINNGMGVDFSSDIVYLAIGRAARTNLFHPIRAWLESLEWDRAQRAGSLFVDYLGAPDTPYHWDAATNWLVAAVARVFEPGHKFDFMPILEGGQGIRKSTFVEVLGSDWGGTPDIDWGNQKTFLEKTQGFWIIEVPELTSLTRADTNSLKSGLSRTEDVGRLAYARQPVTMKRQCVFMGTTNDRDYLRDDTGGRRFWPIVSTKTQNDPIDTELLRSEAPQIWAEAVHIYREKRRNTPRGYLDLSINMDDATVEALDLQVSRKAESAEDVLAGKISAWLAQPIGGEFDDLDPDAPKQYRAATCTQEIWERVMGRNGVPMDVREPKIIAGALRKLGWEGSHGSTTDPEVTPTYGRCRVFRKPLGVPGETTQ